MKKTVQIVTVPCKQPSYLLKILDNSIANTGRLKGTIEIHDSPWDTDKEFEAQQLLVLSDDVQHGDISYHSGNRTHIYDKYSCTENCKKVISSYPNIEGTLPLSKETIQEWIDNGTPKECSVDMLFWCKDGHSLAACEKQAHCSCSDYPETEVDFQGNLILEFDKQPLKEIMDSVFDKWEATNKIVTSHLEKAVKVSIIPTDEEIEEKAEEYANLFWDANSLDTTLIDESRMWDAGKVNYQNGYKQALKDLGYDK